jgi:hypothetical protein
LKTLFALTVQNLQNDLNLQHSYSFCDSKQRCDAGGGTSAQRKNDKKNKRKSKESRVCYLAREPLKMYVRLALAACSSVLVVTSPPATEEIGAIGREIESRQGC